MVHAKKGQRQLYQPIQSQLTASCQPLDIVAALLDVYPFTQLYIADLNAIQKINSTYSSNFAHIANIQALFPQLTLWVDAGISNRNELDFWQKLNVRLVIGSENFIHLEHFLSLQLTDINWILSLDFMGDGYRGPSELLTEIQHWPTEVIVMSLANVGANQGPNFVLLNEIRARSNDFKLIAAGGVRQIKDMLQLKDMELQGVLLASALHTGSITSADIEKIIKYQ